MPLLVAILLLSAIAAAAQQPGDARPSPPLPLSPPDDPDQERCLTPDPRQGIKLTWKRQDQDDDGVNAAHGIATYIEIRRANPETEEWRPWVKKYANPPFMLNAANPRVYDAIFAWRVWTVDRSGTAQPYATPSDWWMFCTKPRTIDRR